MRIGVYGAALGSIQQEKSLTVIANNLANGATPGYKKDGVHFKDFIFQETHTQMDQGRIRSTGNPLDIAIEGTGFLKVQTDEGVLYTRAGNLTLNRQNMLATQEGWPVLGKSGPIQITKSDIRVERNGQVFDGNDQVDSFDIVQFNPQASLVKTKNGYFKPAQESTAPVPAEDCQVLQGSLEEPNFNIVEEMTHMIETMRMFEAYQKTMQFFDQQDAQVNSKLGSL